MSCFQSIKTKRKATMKVIFLVDNVSNVEMFVTVRMELPNGFDVLLINMDRWSKRTEIEHKLQELELDYRTIGNRTRPTVSRMLDEVQPNVVVLPDDAAGSLNGLFISCAGSRCIPTLLVPHGMMPSKVGRNLEIAGMRAWIRYYKFIWRLTRRIIQPGNFSWRRLVESSGFWLRHGLWQGLSIGGHGRCSKIAVFGNTDKELFASEGISPGRIVVTGNPKFDYLFYAKESDFKSSVCRRLSIADDEDIILLLTDWFVEAGYWTVEQREQFVTAVCEAASKLPHSKLVIKLHPLMEREADYHKIIKDLPQPPVICQNVPLWELVHACSLAITVSSTAGIESMAAGKPLIIFNLFNEPSTFDETSGVVIVHKEDDLLPALESILYQGLSEEKKEAAKKFVYQHAYVQDGRAARRIADLIVQMAIENKDRSVS